MINPYAKGIHASEKKFEGEKNSALNMIVIKPNGSVSLAAVSG